MRSVELNLLGRPGLTHAILRPAWFMQNFSETFLKPIGGAIVVPAGDGAEAFVDAEDIAAVASATLADPEAHAGAQYALTGPEALTIAEAAKIISDVSGQAVDYIDIDRGEWVAAAVAGGVPAEYGTVPTGIACSNRYVSVLSIVDRKIVHWRGLPRPASSL